MIANAPIWKETKLGSVLRYLDERVTMDDNKQYLTITVKRRHGGLEIREKLFGHQISTKKQSRLVLNAFILSRVQCWHQAYAIVGDVPPNTIASMNYDQFAISPEVDRRFFWWLSHSPAFTESVRSSAVGVVIEKMVFNRDVWLKKSVLLPPLAEQRRIVAQIEEVSAHIDEVRALRQQAIAEAELLFSSQLNIAMTPHGKGWKRETVGSVIESMDAGWSPQCDDIPATEGQWGVLKTTAVQWCEFQSHQNKALPPTLQPIAKLAVKEGDVLVTRAGPRKRVGVVAAVRRDAPKLTISDKLIRIRSNRLKVEPRFLELSLASPFSQEHFVQRKTGLADAQVNISQAILKATPVAFPSLAEQCRIVSELDALQTEVGKVKRLQSETAAELDALLPSILDRAFRGEL